MMDTVSDTTGLQSTAGEGLETDHRLACSLDSHQAIKEARTFPLVNGLHIQSLSNWPRTCCSQDLEDEVPYREPPSPVCFGPLGMENLSDQLLIRQSGLKNDVSVCRVPGSPSYASPPLNLLDGTVQGMCHPDSSMSPTKEQSEADTLDVNGPEKGALLKPSAPHDIRKHRQRQGRSTKFRSGSPYSSDSFSSSCLSDQSTTPKDTYSNETNETSSSSAEVGNEKDKTSLWSMANFDRVLHDAPKREHIRSRKCGKGGDSHSDSGSVSQFRSKSTKVPPMIRGKLHGRAPADITIRDSEASSSSASTSMDHAHFRQDMESSERKAEKSCTSNGTDTGIATSSASSLSQSTHKSSSGIDTRQRGGKERKTVMPKSVGLHYHEIRISSGKRKELSEDNFGVNHHHQHHLTHRQRVQHRHSSDSAGTDESERKRRRFNRTFVLLRHCGLLELTLQTASLMQQSTLMNQQLNSLRQQTQVLYNAMQALSTSQQAASSYDGAAAQEIMKNLRQILNRQDGHAHSHSGPLVSNLQHMRRMAVKRTSSGETISPDSCNAQSSSTVLNSGSST